MSRARHSIWRPMRDHNRVAIGWPLVGDLSDLEFNRASRERIAALLSQHYSYLASNVISRKAGEILRFATLMKDGDPVLAASGTRILGFGRIAGPYRFDPQFHEEAPHRRRVYWEPNEPFRLPAPRDGLRTTVYSLKSLENHLEVERRLYGLVSRSEPPRRPHGRSKRLDGVPGRIQSIVERKGQVILYGPPGTGKTFWARRAALDLAALRTFDERYSELDAGSKAKIEGSESQSGLLRMCTFHPAYGYEDFIEGYRPGAGTGRHVAF